MEQFLVEFQKHLRGLLDRRPAASASHKTVPLSEPTVPKQDVPRSIQPMTDWTETQKDEYRTTGRVPRDVLPRGATPQRRVSADTLKLRAQMRRLKDNGMVRPFWG